MAQHPPCTIRPLEAGDASAWRPLWAAYLAFYETELPESVFDTTFARLVDPARPDMSGWIAETDDRASGLVHVISHPHCWRPEGTLYLQDLFVAPEARGRGVGRALIETVYRHGDAIGVPSVYWTTQDFNATARALYDRIGTLTPFIKYARA